MNNLVALLVMKSLHIMHAWGCSRNYTQFGSLKCHYLIIRFLLVLEMILSHIVNLQEDLMGLLGERFDSSSNHDIFAEYAHLSVAVETR